MPRLPTLARIHKMKQGTALVRFRAASGAALTRRASYGISALQSEFIDARFAFAWLNRR